jgi:hypothetical protein
MWGTAATPAPARRLATATAALEIALLSSDDVRGQVVMATTVSGIVSGIGAAVASVIDDVANVIDVCEIDAAAAVREVHAISVCGIGLQDR